MTEAEANQTRCCGPSDCGYLGDPEGDGQQYRYCLASKCMGWRAIEKQFGKIIESIPVTTGSVIPGGDWHYNTNEKSPLWVKYEIVSGGYCGLAGQP